MFNPFRDSESAMPEGVSAEILLTTQYDPLADGLIGIFRRRLVFSGKDPAFAAGACVFSTSVDVIRRLTGIRPAPEITDPAMDDERRARDRVREVLADLLGIPTGDLEALMRALPRCIELAMTEEARRAESWRGR